MIFLYEDSIMNSEKSKQDYYKTNICTKQHSSSVCKYIINSQTGEKKYIDSNYVYINCFYYGFWIHKNELGKYSTKDISMKDYYKLK